jgi:hypothetical protein
MTLTKHRKLMLERVLKIQASHPEPESFEPLIVWLQTKLEKRVKAKKKKA